jgi:hypothetical protein
MNLPQIMDESLDLLRKYIKSIVTFTVGYTFIMFLILLPLIILIGVYAGVVSLVGFSFISIAILLVLAVPIIIGISLSYNTGVVKFASQEYLNESIYASEAIKASFKSILKFTGIAGIALLLFIPALVIIGVIGYFIYKQFENVDFMYSNFGDFGILLVIIMILLILAIYFVFSVYITLYTFSLQAVVIEKMGVFDSIKRSFYLVKKNFWRIFGSLLLFQLTVSGISISLQSFVALVFGLVYLIMELLNIHQDYTLFITTIYSYANWPISIISWLVISPIWVIMSTKLYFNIRFQREGYDMVLKLREIRNITMKESASDI